VRGCFVSQLDLSLARAIQVGVGSSNVQLRLDVFNLFNQAAVTNRNTTMQMANPAANTVITNLPFDAAGNVVDARSRPRGAGFGVATDYQNPRTVQLQLRFAF
jgi:outer membrane receptor protein involved in Fe transport